MKVFIASGSNENIPKEYLDETEKICQLLCDLDLSLVFGTYSKGMMGVCYQTFKENNKDILGITIDAYHETNINFKDIKVIETDSSFKRLEYIFKESDIFLFLPGGTGSLGELFGLMEELKTSNLQKKIIIYNYKGFYNGILDYLNILSNRRFAYQKELDKLIIVDTKEKLERVIKNERN